MRSLITHVSRLVATTIVAALIASLLSLATATSAEAAQKRLRGFHKPTSIAYVSARCVEVSQGVWDVTAKFKVRGGRYANLGNPTKAPRYNDNVYRGGKRFVASTVRFYGWPSEDRTKPVAVPFLFQQMVAPIRTKRDMSTWVNIHQRPTVNLSCN